MVMIREFRVIMPLSLEEYRIGHLYMVQKLSAKESLDNEDGDGVELLTNEPFEEGERKGQYTHKIYHLAKKVPSWLLSVVPKKALMLEEKAWNCFPHCDTVITSPYFTKFKLRIQSLYSDERSKLENPLELDEEQLALRVVDDVDIAFDKVEKYDPEEDPTKFLSKKTGRGQLKQGWRATCDPVMTAYKLVTVDMPYWGIGPQVEKYMAKQFQRKLHFESNRKLFCWLDEWWGLTLEDIRKKEEETFEMLNQKLAGLKAQKEGVEGATNGHAEPPQAV